MISLKIIVFDAFYMKSVKKRYFYKKVLYLSVGLVL